jgi:hypothetical protein
MRGGDVGSASPEARMGRLIPVEGCSESCSAQEWLQPVRCMAVKEARAEVDLGRLP